MFLHVDKTLFDKCHVERDFTTINSNVYANRKKVRLEEGFRWILHGLIGFTVGVIAFYMTLIEESLVDMKKHYV